MYLDSVFLKKAGGFYIELGANDGLAQSNTAFFEFERNWKGILIEPSEKGYLQCQKNRPSAICVNCACVSHDFGDDGVQGDFEESSLMGSVNGTRRGVDRSSLTCAVALTLDEILDTYMDSSQEIDFMSLDVEGYELNVLRGLTLSKYRPKYMLIEVYATDFDEICTHLEAHDYTLVENVTNYNKNDNPNWDGTHNDYLFRSKCTKRG